MPIHKTQIIVVFWIYVYMYDVYSAVSHCKSRPREVDEGHFLLSVIFHYWQNYIDEEVLEPFRRWKKKNLGNILNTQNNVITLAHLCIPMHTWLSVMYKVVMHVVECNAYLFNVVFVWKWADMDLLLKQISRQ